jgi:hypothetical protein
MTTLLSAEDDPKLGRRLKLKTIFLNGKPDTEMR